MKPAPLGRSLVPLPDESLPGYVLRLAHRLELSPARITTLTQLPMLKTISRASAQSTITMDAVAAENFGIATRLAPHQVAGLCLDRYADRYPPLRMIETNSSKQLMAITRRGWVLTASTRYCPQCLAGDGSVIQRRHGGAWQQRWRLQVVFACITHQRLLEYLCPQCGNPAMKSNPASTNRDLLPRLSQPGLHSAQCRNQGCHARLDITEREPGHLLLPADVLEFQARILHRLNPNSTVAPGDASRYFELLALVYNMIMLSWPQAQPLIGLRHLDIAAHRHVLQAQQAVETAQASPRNMETNRPLRTLPHASDSTAGLLLAADRILNWPDLEGLAARLTPFMDAAALQPWAWYPLRIHENWPPAVRRAFLPQVKGFAVPARPSGVAPIPPRPCKYGAEHVPQRLPDEWCQRHLGPLTGINVKYLRRAAALKLFETATGQAWSAAAEQLHMPRPNAELAVHTTRAWMRQDANQQAFDHAIEALAQELENAPRRFDYMTRRTALHTWIMPDSHWHGFVHELETQTTHGRGRRHKLTEERRISTTVLIWTYITHGEYLFAPAVLADKAAHSTQPRTAVLARRVGEILGSPNSYLTLRAIIKDYADRFAAHIDATGSADRFDWNPPTPLTTPPAPRYTRYYPHAQCRGARS
ncbi:TniQ family protein [Nonomuraea sp. NPDC046802]|uniref:TniQ family protein n=1 Tax=Nonomuraea sp. NPDC046802 TaxID=3154919 RepID=UPI0033EA4DBC